MYQMGGQEEKKMNGGRPREGAGGHAFDAATKPVGCLSMTSLAKLGPERKAAGCRRPRAWGINSDIMLPVPSSRPLLTEIMGTSGGRRSYNITCLATMRGCP